MIIFGTQTSDDFGLLVEQFSLRKKARKANSTYSIPGKPEPVIETEETFDPVTINVTCDTMNCENLDAVFEWLNGKGILIDDRHPDKYRIAQVPEEIEVTAVNDEICSITIPFLCSAFMYATDNKPIEIYSSPASIEVKGSYYCEPLYELHFSSDSTPGIISFFVNGDYMTINITEEHLKHVIVLNSQVQKIYYKDTRELIMPDTTGAVPYMNYGGYNQIQWQSDEINLEKVVVTKNERWL